MINPRTLDTFTKIQVIKPGTKYAEAYQYPTPRRKVIGVQARGSMIKELGLMFSIGATFYDLDTGRPVRNQPTHWRYVDAYQG